MTPSRHSQRVPTDVAEVLARAYLRLTERRDVSATSKPVSGEEKHLDLRAEESPDRVQESA